VICYHEDAFDEVEVAYPKPGWTWEDLATKARALTLREGGEVTRWGLAIVSSSEQMYLIESQTGRLVDTTTDPPTLRFDQPQVFEVMRWYADLYLQEEAVVQAQSSEGHLDYRVLYDGGLAAMWIHTFTGWQGTIGWSEVGIVPFPVDDTDSHSTPLRVRALVMSAGTQHPNAAWRWMDFLSRQPINDVTRGPQYLPARRSVAETSSVWETLTEEEAAILRYALDHSYTTHRGPEHDPIRGTLHRVLHAILDGEKSVKEALAEAQEQATADIQEYQDRLAQITPVPSFVVAGSGEKPDHEDIVEITFTPGVDSRDLQRYRQLAEGFQRDHSYITVEVESAPSPDLRDLQTFANAADCFLGYPTFQNPKSRAAILNLGPLLEADSSFIADDFYPPLLEPFTMQGQLWGLPAEAKPYVIKYNKDLFDAAGLDYPALDWTADDFLSLSRALTWSEGGAKQYGFVSQVYEGDVLPLILERLGAKLVDESINPPTVCFDDPTTVEALRWYAGLDTVHSVKPLFVTDLAELGESSPPQIERDRLIKEGQAAMWISSGSGSAIPGDHDGLNIGTVPFPIGPSGVGSYHAPVGYYISVQAQAPRACWEWITFLTGQLEAVEGLPARRSVAESETYRQRVGEERATAYRASVVGLKCPFHLSSEAGWLRGASYWLFQAYGQVLKGQTSVEAALSDAQRKADDYRTCVMARKAYHKGWQMCLEEVDPTLPDFLFETEEQSKERSD
jgi:ABC-type glycerol-3-phosphate transport system substrate-binding protein